MGKIFYIMGKSASGKDTIYKELIENGVEGIMGGHIMLPEYVRELAPELPEEEKSATGLSALLL